MDTTEIENLMDTKVTNLNTLLNDFGTREKIRDVKVTRLAILVEDLRSEKAAQHQALVIMVQTRIVNLEKKLVDLDNSIKKKIVNYASEKELSKEQAKFDKCKDDVSQLKKDVLEHNTIMCLQYDEHLKEQLVKYEGNIVELEARIKTLTARSNIFKDSVYLFLHKAPKDRYHNIIDNTENTVTWIHISIAYLTILFQMVVYLIILVLLAAELINEKKNEMITSTEEHIEPPSLAPTTFTSTLIPRWTVMLSNFTIACAIGILLGNLLPDIIGIFVLRIRLRLVWAQFLILFEILLALFTAFSFASQKIYNLSHFTQQGLILEVFIGMIGIIFIHSFDERIRLAMDTFGLLQRRSKVSLSILLVFLLPLSYFGFYTFSFLLFYQIGNPE